MRYQELIDTLQESAFDVSIKLKTTYPSIILGICLYRYKNGYIEDTDITQLYNPFGVLNPSTLEKVKYDSLYNGIINGLENDFIMENIDSEEVSRLIKSWSLTKYDIAYLKSTDKIIIDLTNDQKKPFIDQYTVYKDNKIILTTSSLEEVISMVDKDDTLKVKNSKGKLINPKPIPTTYTNPNIKAATTEISSGTKVVCSGINMYNSPSDTKPSRCLNGVYYIYNGKEVDGMYQLCQKKIINGQDTVIPLGYVKGSELA